MNDQMPIEELLYEEEGAALDFKREQYPFNSETAHQKSEIIKDILAFSNAWRRGDAYILLGVEEVKGGRSRPLGIEDELDDAQLQQFVNSKTQRPIDFTYSTVVIDGLKIGVIRIPKQSRPIYVEKDYGRVKKRIVYIRRGSSTDEASPEEVHSMGRAEVIETKEVPDLSFEFASLEKRASLGVEKSIETTLLNIPSIKNIPDYQEGRSYDARTLILSRISSGYYRDLVKYYYTLKRSKKLSFSLANNSSITVLDIRVEIVIEKQGDNFNFLVDDDFPEVPRAHYNPIDNIVPLSEQILRGAKPSIEIQDLGDEYRIEVIFEKVQPKQTVFCDESIFIGTNRDFSMCANVIIYADNIPVPIEASLLVHCNVKKEPGSLEDIITMHKKRSGNFSQ